MIAVIRRAIHQWTRRTVRRSILLWDASGNDERPYRCFLIYRKRDPFAVTLLVPDHTTTGKVTEVVFERGLLIEGFDQPAGDGAVRVEPHIVVREYTSLTLPVTRDGKEFYTERAPLEDFITETCALVRCGSELPQVNAELDRWLAGVAL
ncbi:SsgA family sporulation/cell division regulator [Nonomuraea sp. CA-143628]|uniref:SsgA family sporulation/cell division regulator n=1 Tax=Nonomuraea sp. CA-143628 TaxID=3239997 RepID=UPI003D9434E8